MEISNNDLIRIRRMAFSPRYNTENAEKYASILTPKAKKRPDIPIKVMRCPAKNEEVKLNNLNE